MSAPARATWRAVVVPSEHGGWGLTLEPALLGLLVAPSLAGGALAVAAFLAFVVRTPLKVVLVDRRRQRKLERDHFARQVLVAELAVLLAMVAITTADAGLDWVLPFAVALPLFATELWFDSRSRSRRLVPELCGAIGICAVAASIALAGGESAALAIALWCVLAARAVASVPFARTQVLRLRTTPPSPRTSDLAQLAGVVLAAVAVAIDEAVLLGAVAVVLVTLVQFAWSRGPARPAKTVGFAQLGFGLAVVFATAIGVTA
jgi:hypothetical protein